MSGRMRQAEVDSTILYELICCSEWKDEREEKGIFAHSASNTGSFLALVNYPRKYFRKNGLNLPDSVKWLQSAGPQWKISLSKDGAFLAILQDCILETRSVKDGFLSTLGRTAVLKDPYLQNRKMVWSKDSSILAVSFSNGQIIFYDIMASVVTTVRRYDLPSQESVNTDVFSPDNILAGLLFSSERVKKNMHPNELLCFDSKGLIKSFRQTQADQMSFHHDASLRKYYPSGIFSVEEGSSHGIIIVSGIFQPEYSIHSASMDDWMKNGITVWRLVNDAPYYRILYAVDNEDFKLDTTSRLKRSLSSLFYSSAGIEDAVFKLVMSPDEKHAVALHTSGAVSVWQVPSLRRVRFWPLKNQYHHWTENTRFNNRWRIAFNRWHSEPVDEWRFHPFDVDWWSDVIIVISRVNGCVSLCSIQEEYPSRNLLGDLPELFESPVSVTPRVGKGFLALECETKLKVEEQRNSNGDIITPPEATSVELLDAYDSQFLAKTLLQEVVFWMTEIERFRPPRKRKRKPPVWKETHRLFLIRNITPLELFYQKIEVEEYGEALDLARVYCLDSDVVFQRQWARTPVSVHSIRDYLGKIKKRNWVLQECLDRVPENADAARELLQYGLKGTDLSVAVLISQGRDKGRFHLLRPDDLDISHEEYLLLVDADNLEVKRLLNFRKKFLYYLDILDTYELMIGGPTMVDENFDGNVYEKLRLRRPIESAIELTHGSDINALRIMLTHHWLDIAPDYLEVLSSFPETTNPYEYSEFLPELGKSVAVYLWDDYVDKNKDWCETFLEDGNAVQHSSNFTSCISADDVASWYEKRVREIDNLSGLTNHSLELARLGIKKGVKSLQNLKDTFEVMEILIYDANIDITLEKVECLNNFEILKLLMTSVQEKFFSSQVREFIIPFLEKCDAREKGTYYSLLDQYLTSISAESIGQALPFFVHSKSGTASPIIPDKLELMKLAYNCIYACTQFGQTGTITAILECLPEKSRGFLKEDVKTVQDKLDRLDRHFQAVKTLEKYDIFLAIVDLQNLSEDSESETKIKKFVLQMCKMPLKKKLNWKVSDWKAMLFDILDLQKKVFTEFPVEVCFEIYVTALLRSGSTDVINLARDFIDRTLPEKSESISENPIRGLVRRVSSAYSSSFSLYLYLIPYERSLEMILESATHYFDSASNFSDPDIELCRSCLNLVPNIKEPAVAQMFDLIDAVKIINRVFLLNVLPQTVRLKRDKLSLIRDCMENLPDGYRKTQQLLKLSVFLQLEDMDASESESYILDMCGEKALLENDLKFCVQICHSIMAKGYQTGWKIFTHVAKEKNEPAILDHHSKLVFISYALNMCPDDEIMNVLDVYVNINYNQNEIGDWLMK